MATSEKQVMVVGIDEYDQSTYALQWTLDHFFANGPNSIFKLLLVHAKPTAASAVGLAGPGAADVWSVIDANLRKIAARVVEKAKETCTNKSLNDVAVEVVEGDARNVLCDGIGGWSNGGVSGGEARICGGEKRKALRSLPFSSVNGHY